MNACVVQAASLNDAVVQAASLNVEVDPSGQRLLTACCDVATAPRLRVMGPSFRSEPDGTARTFPKQNSPSTYSFPQPELASIGLVCVPFDEITNSLARCWCSG